VNSVGGQRTSRTCWASSRSVPRERPAIEGDAPHPGSRPRVAWPPQKAIHRIGRSAIRRYQPRLWPSCSWCSDSVKLQAAVAGAWCRSAVNTGQVAGEPWVWESSGSRRAPAFALNLVIRPYRRQSSRLARSFGLDGAALSAARSESVEHPIGQWIKRCPLHKRALVALVGGAKTHRRCAELAETVHRPTNGLEGPEEIGSIA